MKNSYFTIKSIINKHILIKNSVNYIYIKIKSTKKKYKIAFYYKIKHLLVFIDYFAFISLKKSFI